MRPIDAEYLEKIAEQQGHVTIDDILDAPTIAPEPNPPLTLEELREMDTEAVWVCNPKDICWGHMALIRSDPLDVPEYNDCAYAVGIFWSFSDYGKTWLAYRRKPEEGTT